MKIYLNGVFYALKNRRGKGFPRLFPGKIVEVIHDRDNEKDSMALSVIDPVTKVHLGFIPRVINQKPEIRALVKLTVVNVDLGECPPRIIVEVR
jgi:hypothetical protein